MRCANDNIHKANATKELNRILIANAFTQIQWINSMSSEKYCLIATWWRVSHLSQIARILWLCYGYYFWYKNALLHPQPHICTLYIWCVSHLSPDCATNGLFFELIERLWFVWFQFWVWLSSCDPWIWHISWYCNGATWHRRLVWCIMIYLGGHNVIRRSFFWQSLKRISNKWNSSQCEHSRYSS